MVLKRDQLTKSYISYWQQYLKNALKDENMDERQEFTYEDYTR